MVVLCLNKSVVTMFSLCGTMFFSVERGTSQSSRQTCRCVSTWNVCKEMLLVLTFQSLHEAVAELADGPEAAAAQHLLLPLGLVRGSLTQLSGSGGGRGAAPPPQGSSCCSAGFSALNVNSLEFFHPYFCCL